MSHVRVLRKERDLRKLDVDAAIQNATEKKDKEELTKAKGRVAKKKKKEDREDAKDDIRSQQLFLYSPIESELSPVLWATVHKSTGASQHQRLRLAMREDIAEDRKEERKRRREERKDGVDPQQQQQPGPKKKQPRAGEGEVTGEAAAAETMEVGGVQGACLGKTKTMEIPAPRLDDAIVRALAQRLWEVRRVEGGWFLRFRFRWPRVFESLEECEQYARVLLGHLTVRMARPALNEDEKKERARYRDLVLAAFNAEVDENEGKSFFEVLQREAQMESLKAALGWGDDVEEDDIEDYEAADASRWLPFQVDVDATVLYRMVWELLGEVDATLVELESPGKGKKEDRLKGLVDVVLKGDRKKDAEPADEDAARRERTLRGWVEDDVARAIVSCVRHVMEDHVGRMGADDRADLNRALAKELEARMRADRDYEDEFTKKFPWRPLDAVERLEHNDKMARGMDSVDAVLPDKGKPGVDALLATWGGRSSDVFAAVFEEVPLTVDTRTEIVAQHVLEEIEEECERLAGKYHDLEQGLCRRVSSRVKGAFRALTCRGTGAEKAVFEKNLLKTIQVRLKVSLVTDCTVCGLGVNCGKSNHGVSRQRCCPCLPGRVANCVPMP